MTDQADLLAEFSNALAGAQKLQKTRLSLSASPTGGILPGWCGDPRSSSPPSSRCHEKMILKLSRQAARS